MDTVTNKKTFTVDFLGLGAQKSGTSWAYACLYEHPEICAPIKEIHFFSRSRFEKGKEWYESHFSRCEAGKLKGEFSTSYLYSKEAPERILHMYPNAKLIAILRNPVERAYSQYGNAIKGGEIAEEATFQEYVQTEKSALEQGLYTEQLQRYFERFPREQILILIQEDIQQDPEAFMRKIYEFLGVEPNFKASMLHKRVNIARVPKHHELDKDMHYFAEFLRRKGLDRLVHLIRKTGLPDFVRSVNTKEKTEKKTLSQAERQEYADFFKDDIEKLSILLNRNLKETWG